VEGEDRKEDEQEDEPVSAQMMFVKDWATAFDRDKALASVAKMPLLLNCRFDQLYVASSLVTKEERTWGVRGILMRERWNNLELLRTNFPFFT
jgi:hypothetical protein